MLGKASGRWIDAEGKKRYHALRTAEVLRWLKLVPTHLELQIRRPRWWQNILLDREGNEALLGIFFGRLGAEVEGPLLDDGTLSPNAHPWALPVITNECPWCRSIFSTRLDAQHHACSSLLH